MDTSTLFLLGQQGGATARRTGASPDVKPTAAGASAEADKSWLPSSISDLRDRLKREGYPPGHVVGNSLIRQLNVLIKEAAVDRGG